MSTCMHVHKTWADLALLDRLADAGRETHANTQQQHVLQRPALPLQHGKCRPGLIIFENFLSH